MTVIVYCAEVRYTALSGFAGDANVRFIPLFVIAPAVIVPSPNPVIVAPLIRFVPVIVMIVSTVPVVSGIFVIVIGFI